MSDDVKALAGKLRRYARSLEEWEEYEVEAWSDGTSLTTLELTQAADALEAAQLEPVYGDYLEGLEEGMTDGIKIGQAEAAQRHRRYTEKRWRVTSTWTILVGKSQPSSTGNTSLSGFTQAKRLDTTNGSASKSLTNSLRRAFC